VIAGSRQDAIALRAFAILKVSDKLACASMQACGGMISG
jgi:hypothetical protein